jgi:putative restriction endonuclease
MVDGGIFAPGERAALINGEVRARAPQGRAYATAIRLTEDALRAAFSPGHVVRVQFPLSLDAFSEPEPEVTVVRGLPRDSCNAHPSSAVLIVEIAAPTPGGSVPPS